MDTPAKRIPEIIAAARCYVRNTDTGRYDVLIFTQEGHTVERSFRSAYRAHEYLAAATYLMPRPDRPSPNKPR